MLYFLDESLEHDGCESSAYTYEKAQKQHYVFLTPVGLKSFSNEIEEGYLLLPDVYGV